MIEPVPYSTFSLSQLLTLGDQSYKIVKEQHPKNPLLAGVLERLSSAVETAEAAIGSTGKEALAEQVQLSDARRDDNYVGLCKHIEAGLKRHSSPAYQDACKRLIAIFNQNGRNLHRYSYASQTATLQSLFNDLDNAEAKADLSTVKATEWLKELKADQEAFDKVYAQRSKEKAGKDIPTDEAARKELKPAMENLYSVLNAFFISEQIRGLDSTLDILNETIARALASARQSASK